MVFTVHVPTCGQLSAKPRSGSEMVGAMPPPSLGCCCSAASTS
jgi:hypothetical protein